MGNVNILDIFFILLMIVFCTAACFLNDRKLISSYNKIHDFNYKIKGFINKYHIMLVIIVFFTALAVRIYKFGIIPYGFNQDEAMASLEGFTLSQYGTDHFGTSFPVYFTAWIYSQMNVLLSYIMVPFFKLFGVSVFTARLPMVLFSMLSLWVIYKFSYKLFGKNAALAVLFITAINPWQIMIGRWSLESNLLPHFMLYGAYLLYLGFEKKRYLYFSMVIFGLAMYSYGIAYYIVPLFLIIVCIYMIINKLVNFKNVILCFICYTLVSLPIFLTIAVYLFDWQSMNIGILSIQNYREGIRLNQTIFFSDNFLLQLLVNVYNAVGISIFQIPDLPWNSISNIGPLYFCSIPLFITGLVLLIRRIRINRGIFIVSTLFFMALITGFITNGVNINRINTIFYPMIIIMGYAVYAICRKYNFLVIPIVLIFTISFANFNSYYFGRHNDDEMKESYYYGFKESLEYIKDLNYEKIYITKNTQSEGGSYVSEILTLFHLRIDNKYFLGKKDLYDSQGNKLLAYKERYNYYIYDYFVNKDDPDIVYVIYDSEKFLFDTKYYNIIEYGDFAAVVHKDFDNMS